MFKYRTDTILIKPFTKSSSSSQDSQPVPLLCVRTVVFKIWHFVCYNHRLIANYFSTYHTHCPVCDNETSESCLRARVFTSVCLDDCALCLYCTYLLTYPALRNINISWTGRVGNSPISERRIISVAPCMPLRRILNLFVWRWEVIRLSDRR